MLALERLSCQVRQEEECHQELDIILHISYVEECREELVTKCEEVHQNITETSEVVERQSHRIERREARPLEIFSAVPRCYSNKVTVSLISHPRLITPRPICVLFSCHRFGCLVNVNFLNRKRSEVSDGCIMR